MVSIFLIDKKHDFLPRQNVIDVLHQLAKPSYHYTGLDAATKDGHHALVPTEGGMHMAGTRQWT